MDASEWDERYASTDLVWTAEPNQFLPDLVADLSPGRALDVACGEGRNAIWLASQGWDVTGVDFSPVAIAKAGRLSQQAGVSPEFVAADLSTWEPTTSFDLIIEFYLQVPEALRRRVHRSMGAALARGGTYLVVAHHTDNLEHGSGGPQDPTVLFSEAAVVADFAEIVEPLRAERLARTTANGSAIDVLFVGRKGTDSTHK